jgi:glutamate-1-semialdehyde 2,1-aminomutase
METILSQSQQLQERFHRVIPGGSHTYAKGDDQFPQFASPYITHGKGCHVWDVDGNEYIEYAMGLRSVTLGHAYEPVVNAAIAQMRHGTNFNRPCPIELKCAEELLGLLPHAEMVKFAKNGSDVIDGAIRLARAFTNRDLVAICGDQPFFSVGDWFIGGTPMDAGIPRCVKKLTLRFRYNDLDGLAKLFDSHPGRIAAVLLEAEKDVLPNDRYLEDLKRICHQKGALLIFDEMITGFRWHNGGAQMFHGVAPDLSTFGKALGNGFSLSALAGRREIMQLGGLIQKERPRTFLLSTTHGAETHALAAGLEVIRTYQRELVVETLWRQGQRLAGGINSAVADLELHDYFQLSGRPCCLTFRTLDANRQPSQEFRTLFLQEIMRRGIIAPSFVVSYSHTDDDIDDTIDAVSRALIVYKQALEDGVSQHLEGRPVKPVFRRYN